MAAEKGAKIGKQGNQHTEFKNAARRKAKKFGGSRGLGGATIGLGLYDTVQSLTDGGSNPVHGSITMPQGTPVQFDVSIPSSYYPDGNLTLRFVHDNPATTSCLP